jgi:methionyl-tRNA formyltransferase
MRILCCLNRDIASNLALNLLLPVLTQHETRVALSEQVGTIPRNEPRQRRELRIAEQSLFNEVFFPLVETAHAAVSTGRLLTFSQIQTSKKIPVRAVHDPNCGAGLQRIRDFSPDVIVVIRYGAIFQRSVLEIPPLGVINLHSGILPRYRGVLATFRALANKDSEVGCTLHYIVDPTIDTGDIISVSRMPVVAGHSLLRHVLGLYPSGTQLLVDALRALASGDPLPHQMQPRDGGEYYSYPTQSEWDEFCGRGWSVADPSDLESTMGQYLPARAEAEAWGASTELQSPW